MGVDFAALQSQDLEGALRHLCKQYPKTDITRLARAGSLVHVRGLLLAEDYASPQSQVFVLASVHERSLLYCVDVGGKFGRHHDQELGLPLATLIAADNAVTLGNTIDVWGELRFNDHLLSDRPQHEAIIDMRAFIAHPYRGSPARLYHPKGLLEQRDA